jgi:hypothetical protein
MTEGESRVRNLQVLRSLHESRRRESKGAVAVAGIQTELNKKAEMCNTLYIRRDHKYRYSQSTPQNSGPMEKNPELCL